MPKSGGVTFCGLVRFHGNIGAVSRNRQHPPLHNSSRIHDILARLTGDGLLTPLVAASASVPVVHHIDGFGGVHAAAASACARILHLDGQHLTGRKSINAFVLVAVGREDISQIPD